MPNRPDKSNVWGSLEWVEHKLLAGENRLQIRPRGWLVGLVMRLTGPQALLAAVDYELTDTDGIALYGHMAKPDYYETAGLDLTIQAMILPEPIPNVNAAHPYILRIASDREVSITVTQLWHMPEDPFQSH